MPVLRRIEAGGLYLLGDMRLEDGQKFFRAPARHQIRGLASVRRHEAHRLTAGDGPARDDGLKMVHLLGHRMGAQVVLGHVAEKPRHDLTCHVVQTAPDEVEGLCGG